MTICPICGSESQVNAFGWNPMWCQRCNADIWDRVQEDPELDDKVRKWVESGLDWKIGEELYGKKI